MLNWSAGILPAAYLRLICCHRREPPAFPGVRSLLQANLLVVGRLRVGGADAFQLGVFDAFGQALLLGG